MKAFLVIFHVVFPSGETFTNIQADSFKDETACVTFAQKFTDMMTKDNERGATWKLQACANQYTTQTIHPREHWGFYEEK